MNSLMIQQVNEDAAAQQLLDDIQEQRAEAFVDHITSIPKDIYWKVALRIEAT
jgi:hypothetical protein